MPWIRKKSSSCIWVTLEGGEERRNYVVILYFQKFKLVILEFMVWEENTENSDLPVIIYVSINDEKYTVF